MSLVLHSWEPESFPPCALQIKTLKVEAIIRGGLRRFTDMIGQLWSSLADYYIRSGHFEKVGLSLTKTCYF